MTMVKNIVTTKEHFSNLIVSQLKQSDVQCNVIQEEAKLLENKQDIGDKMSSVPVGQDPEGRHIEDSCEYASASTNCKIQM